MRVPAPVAVAAALLVELAPRALTPAVATAQQGSWSALKAGLEQRIAQHLRTLGLVLLDPRSSATQSLSSDSSFWVDDAHRPQAGLKYPVAKLSVIALALAERNPCRCAGARVISSNGDRYVRSRRHNALRNQRHGGVTVSERTELSVTPTVCGVFRGEPADVTVSR